MLEACSWLLPSPGVVSSKRRKTHAKGVATGAFSLTPCFSRALGSPPVPVFVRQRTSMPRGLGRAVVAPRRRPRRPPPRPLSMCHVPWNVVKVGGVPLRPVLGGHRARARREALHIESAGWIWPWVPYSVCGRGVWGASASPSVWSACSVAWRCVSCAAMLHGVYGCHRRDVWEGARSRGAHVGGHPRRGASSGCPRGRTTSRRRLGLGTCKARPMVRAAWVLFGWPTHAHACSHVSGQGCPDFCAAPASRASRAGAPRMGGADRTVRERRGT